MKNKLLLLLVMLISFNMQAQIPSAARISMKDRAADEAPSELGITTLQRIQLLVNDQNQVQAVFLFDDNTDVVFDNVEAIQFITENIAEIDYNTPTSVETIPDAAISLYPNPAAELIHISGMSEGSHGTVFDINGRRICDIDSRHTTMDVSGWVNGTYLIRIDNRIFKLIKQ